MMPFLAGMFGQASGGTSAPQGGDSVTIDTPFDVGSGSMRVGGGGDFTWVMFLVVVAAGLYLVLRRR